MWLEPVGYGAESCEFESPFGHLATENLFFTSAVNGYVLRTRKGKGEGWTPTFTWFV